MNIWSYSLVCGIAITKLLLNYKDDKRIYSKKIIVITAILTIIGFITYLTNG